MVVSNISNTALIHEDHVVITAGTNGNRTITVHPYADQNGSAVITLLVTDADGATATVTFTVNVAPVNDAPVAVDRTSYISEDSDLKTLNQNAAASDVDIATNGDELTLTIITPPKHGTANATAEKTITYKPDANFNGTDSFVYEVTDKAGAKDTSTLTYIISQVNDAPVTTSDSAETTEDKAVDIDVLSNDSDVDKDPALNADPNAEVLTALVGESGLKLPGHGAVTSDGTKLTYTPNENYNGTDTFEYYCYDGEVKVVGSVSVTITQVNDAPVAAENTAETNEDTATTAIDVLANDSDVDTDGALNLGTLHTRDTFEVTEATLTTPAHGVVTITPESKLVFTPALNWFGTEVIHYTMSDGNGLTAKSILTVTVHSVNDLPYLDIAPANMNLTEDGADGSSLFGVNDVETVASALSVTVKSSDNPTLIATSDVTIEKTGGGGRSVVVNPKDNQNGSARITLTLEDADGGKLDLTFDVTVAAENDKPVAESAEYNIQEDAGLQTRLKADLTSDVDIATNDDSVTLSISIPAAHGTAAIDENGNITYLPDANFNGTDSFEYTATDEALATAKATLTFQIAPVNDAPNAQNDAAETNEDQAVVITVMKNDSDVDMDQTLNANPEDESISVLIDESGLNAPTHGKITTDGATITYTPNKDYNGADSFDYYCYDGEYKTKATVELTITQVNDNPKANSDSATIGEDGQARTCGCARERYRCGHQYGAESK